MTSHPGSHGLFQSPGMQLVLRAADEAVSVAGGVLIRGEAGSGRETLARAIHQASTSPLDVSIPDLLATPGTLGSLAPFVVVDCATPQDLEYALFGRMPPGGADGLETCSPPAVILKARGGTLFLRAVQEMPRRVQSRLARVLRDGELRVQEGDASRITAVAARIIASMDIAASSGVDPLVPELRQRLAAHHIEIPPLRHRRDDLPALVALMLAAVCESQRLPPKSMTVQAISLLSALPWRGNLGELRTLLQLLTARVSGRTIRLADVLANVGLDGSDVTFAAGGTLREARERFERDYVAAVLERHQGRMADAARALGVQRANLYRKVRQLGARRHVLGTDKTAAPQYSRRSGTTDPRPAGESDRHNEEDSLELP